jgi:hypothetical protein
MSPGTALFTMFMETSTALPIIGGFPQKAYLISALQLVIKNMGLSQDAVSEINGTMGNHTHPSASALSALPVQLWTPIQLEDYSFAAVYTLNVTTLTGWHLLPFPFGKTVAEGFCDMGLTISDNKIAALAITVKDPSLLVAAFPFPPATDEQIGQTVSKRTAQQQKELNLAMEKENLKEDRDPVVVTTRQHGHVQLQAHRAQFARLLKTIHLNVLFPVNNLPTVFITCVTVALDEQYAILMLVRLLVGNWCDQTREPAAFELRTMLEEKNLQQAFIDLVKRDDVKIAFSPTDYVAGMFPVGQAALLLLCNAFVHGVPSEVAELSAFFSSFVLHDGDQLNFEVLQQWTMLRQRCDDSHVDIDWHLFGKAIELAVTMAKSIHFRYRDIEWQNVVADILEQKYQYTISSPYKEADVDKLLTTMHLVKEAVRTHARAFGHDQALAPVAVKVMTVYTDDAGYDASGGGGAGSADVVHRQRPLVFQACSAGVPLSMRNSLTAFDALLSQPDRVVESMLDHTGCFSANTVFLKERNCPGCRMAVNRRHTWCGHCGFVFLDDIWRCSECKFLQTQFAYKPGKLPTKATASSYQCTYRFRGCLGIFTDKCRSGSSLNADDFESLRFQIEHRNSRLSGSKSAAKTDMAPVLALCKREH